MDNSDQNSVTLASVLKIKGLNISKFENILNQITFSNKKNEIHINFPHKFLYEFYKNEFKNIIESNFSKNIQYNINNSLSTHNIKSSNNHYKNPEYRFDNFITGKNNKIIIDICKKISNKEQIIFNPVLLYGESSTGKTHLINSIINELKYEKIYTADLFPISSHLGEYNISKVYNEIIKYDFAALENINEIQNNKPANILMEKIIDHYYENNKQIILTCQGNKINYPLFSQGLQDRIISGLTLKLKKPDLNTKINFAKRFCSENKLNLPGEYIFTISTNSDNIRSIKGVLLKLALLHKDLRSVTPSQLNRLFEESGKNTQVDFKSILEIVSEFFEISESDLLNTRRGKKVSLARQICMYICKKKLNWSYPEIGFRFGGRNHSTVIYSVKKIEKLKKVNKEIDIMVTELFQKVEKSSNI
ncbi:MAG: helix-turn-helix domain-containing protein [Desulfonatronovibrio sp.]